MVSNQAKLIREPGAGSGERGKRERGVGIVVRNPKIEIFEVANFKNSNFS
jgi:hypothetical protein